MDDAGRLLDVCDIGDDPYGYAYLSTLLAERASGPYSVAIAADSDQRLVPALLATAGWAVAFVDTDSTDDFADRFADDMTPDGDSAVMQRRALGLARALHAGALSAGSMPAPTALAGLKPVLAAHGALATGRHAAAVALREVLRELYPAALRAYPDPADPVALAVMDALPEPGALASSAAGRGRDAAATADAVSSKLAASGLGDPAAVSEAITALRVAIAETPRRGGVGRDLTATVAETVRQAVAAVRACDSASTALVRALAGRIGTVPAATAEPPEPIGGRDTAPTTAAPHGPGLPGAGPVEPASPARPTSPIPTPLPPRMTPPPVPAAAPLSPPPQAVPPPPPPPPPPPAAPPPQAPPAAPPAQPPPPGPRPPAAPPAMHPPPPPPPPPPAPPPTPPAPMAPPPAAPPPMSPPPMAAASPAPPETGYGPPDQRYGPPPDQRYAPTDTGYTRPDTGYARSDTGYSPPEGGYSPPDTGYAPPEGGYAPPTPTGGRPVSAPPPPPPGITPIGEPRSPVPTQRPAQQQPEANPWRDERVPLPTVDSAPPGGARASDASGGGRPTDATGQGSPLPSRAARSGGSPPDRPQRSGGRRRAEDQAPAQPSGTAPPWRSDDLVPPEPPLRLVEPTLPEELREDLGYGGGPDRADPPSLRLVEPPSSGIPGSPGNAASGSNGYPGNGYPSNGYPENGAPTGGLPSTGLPSSGSPSTGIPSSGLPSSGVPHSGIPSSGVPRSAPPVSADDDDNLLIFAQTRSAWFSGEDDAEWSSRMDAGWRAAEQAASKPAVGDRTGAGLPRRVPRANLVPGSPPTTERQLRVVRDPSSIAAHTSGYFNGWRRGQEVGGVGGYPLGNRQQSAGAWDFTRDVAQ